MGRDAGGGRRWRAGVAVALVVVGSLSLTIALVVGWAQRTVFDGDEFATRTVSVLDSSAVRHALAEKVTDELIENGSSSLASYRAELVGVVNEVLTTDGFRVIFRNAVRQAHRAAFQRNGAAAVLELGETLELLSDHAGSTSSSLATKLPSATGSLLVDVTPTLRRLNLWRFANDIRRLDEVALAVTAIAFAGAIALDRRRLVVILAGVGVATAGLVVVLVAEIIPAVAVNTIHDHSESSAIGAGVKRFVADLAVLGLWTIPFGIILAAAAEASERSDRSRLGAWVARMRQRRFGELSPAAQVSVGVGTLVAGILLLVLRDQIVSLAVLIGGFFVVYVGAVLSIRALLGPEPDVAPAPRPRHRRRIASGPAATIVAVLLVGGLVTNVTTASGEARERGQTPVQRRRGPPRPATR